MSKFKPHRIKRGALAGRYYKTERGYRAALKRVRDSGADISREERYNQLLQLFILEKGARKAKQGKQRFNELYRKAKKSDWAACPPANGLTEEQAPYAYLLDFIGVRPLDEFGWRCIGDTP